MSDEILDVPVVLGVALMIRRETIMKIGLLDGNYFMYHEEWDWCVRARDAGYRVVCAPRLRVWHNVQEQGTYYAPYFAYFYHRNYFLFAARHCKTTEEVFQFLFRRLVINRSIDLFWYEARGFPILYPLLALKNGQAKAFKAYFAGIIAGIAFFLRHRLFA